MIVFLENPDVASLVRATLAVLAGNLLRASDIDDVEIDLARFRAALDGEIDLFSDPDPLELIGEVGQPSNLLAVGRRDDVAEPAGGEVDPPDSGALGRRAGCGAHDDHPLGTQSGGIRFARRHDADAGRRHPAVVDELRDDAVDDIDGNREADPGIGADGDRIAVVTPISLPAESSNGPPELPGLMALSVLMTLAISRPLDVGSRRLSALMMPLDIDWSSPNGLPIANANWPTFRADELPTATGGGRARAVLIRSTARS